MAVTTSVEPMGIQIWTSPGSPSQLFTYTDQLSGHIIMRPEREIRLTPGLLYIATSSHLETWLTSVSARLMNPIIGTPIALAERICGWNNFTH